MRAKMSVPEPPVPSASTRVISDAPSGKQALIRAGKTLRIVLKRSASRVTLTSLAGDAQPLVHAGCKRRRRNQEPCTFEPEHE